MNEEQIQAMREQAAQMQAQAEALLQAAEAASGEPAAEPETATETTTVVEPLGDEPVSGMPDEDESVQAERDPLVPVDMTEELKKVRAMLPAKGFVKKASSGAGEVWEKPGPRGEPGFKATLIADPHGRIRMEVRNPGGFVIGNAEPATELDCGIALQQVL